MTSNNSHPKCLVRPTAFLVASLAAAAGFVVAGRFGVEHIDWADIGSWLDRTDPTDAFVEILRLGGVVLAGYVAVISAVALLAELAGLVRLIPMQRVLRRILGLVAVPTLRRRLIELGTAATITASSMSVVPAGASPSPSPAAALVVADARGTVPSGPMLLRGDYQGFDLTGAEIPASHLVVSGETLGGVIRDHYGRVDRGLLDEVLAANPQIDDPNLILVGWTIILPVVSNEASAEPVEIVVPRVVVAESTWTTTTVARGDTLWDIVDRHYGHATAELVWAVIDANPDLDDPNLIYSGQVITLPPRPGSVISQPTVADVPAAWPAPASTPPTAPVPPNDIPAVQVSDADIPVVDVPPVDVPVVDVPPVDVGSVVPSATPSSHTPAPTSQPENTVASTALPTSPTGPAPGFDSPVVPADVAGDEIVMSSVAKVVGWTGGAALAAALLALAERRRRRHCRRRPIGRPSRRAAQTGVALRETANLSTVEFAARALRDMSTRTRPRPGEPTPIPRLLRIDNTDVELVWDTPNVDVLDPWQSADGGWSWTINRATTIRATDGPSPCPGLVTVGRRDGADVLLNLENCGPITITGEPDATTALATSIATELAASVFADSPTVLLVGDTLAVAGHPDHARRVTAIEAAGWVRDRRESATSALSQRRLSSLFALRGRARPTDAHEPVIVLIDASAGTAHVEALVELASGDLGAVVIVVGGPASTDWVLQVGDGLVVIEPLGFTVDAVGLSPDLVAVIDELVPVADPAIDEFADDHIEDGVVADVSPLLVAEMASKVQVTIDDTERDDWDVELKVLGQVRAIGTRESLTPTELHLAIYLAFHRNGENADTISCMIWPDGTTERNLVNTMTSLRRKLGSDADGELLFPLGRETQHTYRLSDRVVTDWDRFVALIKRAEESDPDASTSLYERAVALIDGPPFRAASGYSWAYSEGIASEIIMFVEAVAATAPASCMTRTDRITA